MKDISSPPYLDQMRYRLLRLMWLGIISVAWVIPVEAQTQPPNIMLIMGDDLGWYDMETTGNPDIKTPHLASLVRESLRFQNMFTSTAMCSPTRQQLLTGLYPVRSGAYPNHSWVYDSVKSLPHYFNEAGYRTALFGKTHFGPPSAFPFGHLQDEPLTKQTYQSIRNFIRQEPSQPFFMAITSHQPHVPWTKGDTTQYPSEKLSVPPYLIDTQETRRALSLYYAEISYLDDQVGRCLRMLEEASLSDNTIVIFTSEQGPQLPFGKWTCYDMGLKTSFLVRWPNHVSPNTSTEALAQYIDILPTLLEIIGQDPTTVQTGISDAFGNQELDGKSFREVLLGHSSHHRDYVYGVHTTRGIIRGSDSYPIRSVRSDKYLYIQNLNAEQAFSNIVIASDTLLYPSWLEKGETDQGACQRADFYQHRPSEELYDVVSDPYQIMNLASDHQYEAVKKSLKKELTAFMQQQGDSGEETELNALNRQAGYLKVHPQENNKPTTKE
ncbi:MAG: sulfatase [Cyclobacteriaceae bacterium]